MSGACIASSGVAKAAVGTPFSANASLQGGSAFNVSGASGNIWTQGAASIHVDTTGGTAPYTMSVSTVKDGGTGSVFITNPGIANNTVGWSGMSVGDTVLFHLKWSAHDSSSPQQNDSGRDPVNTALTYSIHRTS